MVFYALVEWEIEMSSTLVDLQEYVKGMGDILGDYIGFSGYGEQLGRQQFNQTMSVIVFE